MLAPLHTLAKVPSGGSLEDALAETLSGKPFNDVTFYTAREDGREPRAVHANSRILMSASKYFRDLLSEREDTEPKTAPLAPETSPTLTGSARDGDDSTLGDEDDIDALESLLGTPSEASFGDDGAMKRLANPSEDIKSVTTAAVNAASVRTITLTNVAADTLEAAIFYIYTGHVYFRLLRSPDSSEDVPTSDALERPRRPACCCKAMYAFADEAGLDELRDLADAHLFAQLDKNNILDEVFSPFSARYPAILRRQVTLLLEKHWTPTMRTKLQPIVEQIVRGELPHAAPVLNMLFGEIPVSRRPDAVAADGVSSSTAPPLANSSSTAPPTVTSSPAITPPVKTLPAAKAPVTPGHIPKSSSTTLQPASSPPAATAAGASASSPATTRQSSTSSPSGHAELRSAGAKADTPVAIEMAERGTAAAAPTISPTPTTPAGPAARTTPHSGGWLGKGMNFLKKAIDEITEEEANRSILSAGTARTTAQSRDVPSALAASRHASVRSVHQAGDAEALTAAAPISTAERGANRNPFAAQRVPVETIGQMPRLAEATGARAEPGAVPDSGSQRSAARQTGEHGSRGGMGAGEAPPDAA